MDFYFITQKKREIEEDRVGHDRLSAGILHIDFLMHLFLLFYTHLYICLT